MKLQIPTDVLQKKLPYVNHAVSTRSQMPILLNFHIQAKEGKLAIDATDLEIGIHTEIPAIVEEEGSTTIPAKTFSELIATLTQNAITIQTQDNSLVIKTAKTKNVFQTTDASEYPVLFEEKGVHLATLQKELFQKDFGNVYFAASVDTGRPALAGVYMKKEEDGFLLVATDGYRLSLKHYKTEIKGKEEALLEKPLLIPARVFKEAAAIREDENELSIFVAAEKNQVVFSQGETTLIGRLIDAQFPPYERIIPTDHAASVVFDREELLKAVKICAIFARESANILKLSLQKDKIVVSANSATSSENMVDVDGVLQGEENEIAFNAKYLLDVLNTLESEELVFEMTGPLNPGVFKIKDDPTFLHLIMPIRVQG
jgi:DNA polymerase-3 subunit beta